jgi:hypothetical protein
MRKAQRMTDLEAENRALKEALLKISTAARRDASIRPPSPLLNFIVAQADAALATEPASGEADGLRQAWAEGYSKGFADGHRAAIDYAIAAALKDKP